MSFLTKTPKPPTRFLGDIAEQTAQEGGARTIVWGRVRPLGGNIIQLQAPVKQLIKEKVQGGGKGGSKKKKQKVEHVYRTYAIGICEGPVSGITRIWRNNKLVFDARGNAWGEKNNPVFLQSYRLYLGGWQQMPDPMLETIWGIGNVPAYRGTCYMVAVNEDLTELSGAVPQWQFEVERAETLDIETDLYPLSEIERLSTGATLEGGQLKRPPQWQDHLNTGATLDGGALKSILQQLTIEPEQLTTAATLKDGGALKAILIKHDTDTETLTTGATLEGGSLQ